MKILSVLTICLLTLLSGCATSTPSDQSTPSSKQDTPTSKEQTRSLMIGKWFSSRPTKFGGTRKQITERYSDGQYKIRLRVYKKDGQFLGDQAEVGLWGVAGNIYFLIFTGWLEGEKVISNDPSDPYNYDAYEIIELTDEILRYKPMGGTNEFVFHKVAQDYQFKD